MASKKGECAGSPSGGATSKTRKVRVEGGQSRLVAEEKAGEKRVTFRLGSRKHDEEDYEMWKEEVLTEVRREIRKEFKELETRLEKRIEEFKEIDEVGNLEERLREKQRGWEEGWEKKWKEFKERLEETEREIIRVEKRLEEGEGERGREDETGTSEGSAGARSRSEGGKGVSREGSRYASSGTIWSEDRLSSREVERVRKWVNERDREERKDNIVIRGVDMPVE